MKDEAGARCSTERCRESESAARETGGKGGNQPPPAHPLPSENRPCDAHVHRAAPLLPLAVRRVFPRHIRNLLQFTFSKRSNTTNHYNENITPKDNCCHYPHPREESSESSSTSVRPPILLIVIIMMKGLENARDGFIEVQVICWPGVSLFPGAEGLPGNEKGAEGCRLHTRTYRLHPPSPIRHCTEKPTRSGPETTSPNALRPRHLFTTTSPSYFLVFYINPQQVAEKLL